MFHTGTSPSSNSYREILTRLVACATSQHVSAVALNAAGTGYTAGNLLTIPHAGGYQAAVLEVLTVGGGGAVATVAIRAAGAYSNRVATVAVNAGGSGYPVSSTVILEVQGGTATERAKVAATVNGSGVVTAVSLIETGGAYTVAPAATAATTAIVGPSTATTGSGCTINTTMTGLIGTTGAATTGGTGSGATFDLTLTVGGWTALMNRNGFSTNAINDEKEVILQGTAGTGTDPLIGFRTYTATSGLSTRYGWVVVGLDSFNGSLAFAAQPNIGPAVDPTTNQADCFLLFDNAQTYWFSVKPRRIIAVVKAVGGATTAYTSMHAGLLNPFGTATESPYPLYISASTRSFNRLPDAGGFFVTGLSELFHDAAGLCPAHFRRASDGVWVNVANAINAAAISGGSVLAPIGGTAAMSSGVLEDNIVGDGRLTFDVFTNTGIALASGGAASQALMPALGTNEILTYPLTVLTHAETGGLLTNEALIRGEIDGAVWCAGTKSDGTILASEDTLTPSSGPRIRVFGNAHRTERYSYFGLLEA